MYDIIAAKRDGKALAKEQMSYFIDGLVSGTIPDYQVSALLMAIFFQGMEKEEVGEFTGFMAHSGNIADLSVIPGVKVDKHSTGGVGDKTTLIVAPIVASWGVPVAKMSGRGLGHTGGTIDKLESIVGLRTDLGAEELIKQVKDIGICIASQSPSLCPADAKLYAMRDVTATVNSIPLIASSIMSKKIASGADKILLDVKVGSGALIHNLDEAVELARTMVDIADHAGKEAIALISDMDIPLGAAIGNAVEVMEAISVLQGNGPHDLTAVCIELAATMLELAGIGDTSCERRRMVCQKIDSKEALAAFFQMIKRQGGRQKEDGSLLFREGGGINAAFTAQCSGIIERMDTEQIGFAALALGAGRERKEDNIDPRCGIIFSKKTGDKVVKGEIIAVLEASNQEKITRCKEILTDAVFISNGVEPKVKPHILGRVTAKGKEIFI
jgi:pyrimidine-nucleoside phosphorylase